MSRSDNVHVNVSINFDAGAQDRNLQVLPGEDSQLHLFAWPPPKPRFSVSLPQLETAAKQAAQDASNLVTGFVTNTISDIEAVTKIDPAQQQKLMGNSSYTTVPTQERMPWPQSS